MPIEKLRDKLHAMKKMLLLFTLTVSIQAIAQDFREQFDGFVQQGDSVNQLKVLKQWELNHAADPELYVAWFNYYFINSQREVVQMGDKPQGKDAIQVADSTGGKPVGFLSSTIAYDQEKVRKGLAKIDAAIAKFPSRLDMRFGKCYVLGEMKNYSDFTSEIIKTIVYSDRIKNNWTWRDGKPVEDPKQFMLASLQNYILTLYDANDDSLLENMKLISQTVLKYYPDHVESLSNVSIVLMMQNQPDEALKFMLKAEKLAPNDSVILGNIAHAYTQKGNSESAISYYKKLLAIGDENTKAFAKRKIDELRE